MGVRGLLSANMEEEPRFEDYQGAKEISNYYKEYKVLRQIASGAFGSVHCVQRRDTKVIHAAKYVKSLSKDFLREVQALNSLSNSNLILQFVSFYYNQTGVQSILVTEFLAGGDLCERTSAKDYELNEQKCRTIIRQICRGVQYIHSNRFLHLDLKPFNIVFSKKKDDFDLRIIDFGLAHELNEDGRVKVGMWGTIEYMSPEVMNCTYATPASDMWGVGVIAFMLISGGVSPFFAINRFRTMAKVLACDYSLDQPEIDKTSVEAKDFISRLLLLDPKQRMSAEACLDHPWLLDDKLYLGILETLETSWMRKCLARRRWYRLLNAVRLMTTMRMQAFGSPSASNSGDTCDGGTASHQFHDSSSEETEEDRRKRRVSHLRNGLPVNDISTYHDTFEKLHLIVNNGAFASTLYCVQHVHSREVYAARHVRKSLDNLRKEAEILYQLRGAREIITFHGLFEGPHHSVLVTDYLVGGDLVERTAQPEFILNEAKCKVIIRQICSGLEYMHGHSVVHMDIKPFSVVFANRNAEDVELRITDFCLASRLPPSNRIKVDKMCGTLEFMSPEVLECTYATPATDMWGVGVIAYMLITGGKSPFWAGNRFRTMAKILMSQFDLSIPELKHISNDAKDFIRDLLVPDRDHRMTAAECLEHTWITSDADYVDILYTLETSWMKQLLARRRWQRWYNAVRAMQRIRKLSSVSKLNRSNGSAMQT